MTDVRLTGHLTDTLANIARWYPPTADPPRTAVSQTRTAYGSRPPLPAAVLSLRRQTVDTLTSWALLVCEERDLRGPAKPGDVAALTSFLAAHAEWLAGFDGDYAAHELGHLAHQLEQTVRQSFPTRVRNIGPCPEPDCMGELEATVRKDDDLLPSSVFCGADRTHSWRPGEWEALGRRLPPPPLNPAGVRRLLAGLGGKLKAGSWRAS
jgi:hypothetical protein